MKISKNKLVAAGVSTTDVTPISSPDLNCLVPENISVTSNDQCAIDCTLLPATQLRRKYASEANTHRNMLSRQNGNGAVVHQAFREFRRFLKSVGPMPAKGATLDRIDNNDREYAPGKVRWADRRTQNNNKSDTIVLYDATASQWLTASTLAKRQGVGPSTIRKRLARGWTDAEVISGFRNVSRPRHAPGSQPPRHHREGLQARTLRTQRDAECFKQQREVEGVEPFLASLDVLNEGLPVGTAPISHAQYMRKLKQVWFDTLRFHVIFDRLTPDQKVLVAEIDPSYVASQNCQKHHKATT